jgi:Skp family chaperone for outer membrane proteins
MKIGIVGLRRIFRESQRSVAYREAVLAEQNMTQAKLEQLTNEIAADESGLKTLIRGSADYMQQLEGILHKRSRLRTEKEVYNQRVAFKEQKMTEGLYRDILLATSEVAKQRNLDLVLEKSEPELPASSPTQLELAMGTHKVLYSGGSLDITDEVMRLVDTKENDKAAE